SPPASVNRNLRMAAQTLLRKRISPMPAKAIALRLEKKYAGLTVETVTPDGSFSGYASLFGEVDLGKDAIEPGAFRKSLRERGAAGIRMLWQHDPAQP